MSRFDLAEFEARVETLVAEHERLKAEYAELQAAHAAERRRQREVRDQLADVLARIRALEAETGNV